MPFGAHETLEVHEILNEKINFLNHFQWYAQQVQNGQVRQLIERHIQTAVQSYDQLVAYTHDYNAANQRQQAYSQPNVQPQNIQYGLNNPPQQAPQAQGRFNDQQILSAVLSCHKNSARNHLHAALETADPNIRQILINGAVTCANQAYETFLLLNQQGQYQVPTLNDHTAKTFLHSYQPAPEAFTNVGGIGAGAGAGAGVGAGAGTTAGTTAGSFTGNIRNLGQLSNLNNLPQQ